MYSLKELQTLTNNFSDDNKINYNNISPFVVYRLPQIYKNKWCVIRFTKLAKYKHDLDFSQVNYINRDSLLKLKCNIHNHSFVQNGDSFIKGFTGCYECMINGIFSDNNRKEKIKNNNINKRVSLQDKFIKRANKLHNFKYNYDKVVYVTAKTKVTITCPVHGDFEQIPDGHSQGFGCYKCVADTLKQLYVWDKQTFMNKFLESDSSKQFDIINFNYENAHSKVKVKCKTCGLISTTQFHLLADNKKGCLKCNASSGEKNIQYFLDKLEINYIREYKVKINNKNMRFDFYLSEYNTCIEYDGEQHFRAVGGTKFGGEKEFLNRQKNDKSKNDFCFINNIKLIRIPYWLKVTNENIMYAILNVSIGTIIK